MTHSQSPNRWTSVALRPLLPLLAWICFAVPALHAQFDTGTITGTVTDSTGAVVNNAAVVIENLGTGKKVSATTNGAGNFTASALPFGHYVVAASAPGFGETRSSDINLTVGAAVHVAL